MKPITETLINALNSGDGESKVLSCIWQGADVFAQDKDGRNLLHHIAMHGWMSTLQELREQKLDLTPLVNGKDKDGNTPLHLAAMHNKEDIYVIPSLLVAVGADATLTNKRGKTPAHCALDEGNERFSKKLKNIENAQKVEKQQAEIAMLKEKIAELESQVKYRVSAKVEDQSHTLSF